MVKFDVPQSIDSVIEQSRHIMEEGTFTAFMTFMRAHLPGVARRDEGLFTRMAVAQFLNWQLDENVRRKLTDAQILAAMRVEFPINPGRVFTGDVTEGLKIVQGIRGEYNRDGHGGRTPADRGIPASERYGKFAIGDHLARRNSGQDRRPVRRS